MSRPPAGTDPTGEGDGLDFNPGQFIREVRHETSKVTWPGRRETAITTAMVLAFTVLAATFLFLVDQIISLGVSFILGVGG